MTALFVLVPLGLILLGCAVAAFLWAVKHDQFDDLEREGSRVLMDDDTKADS
ncbi:MAG: cbb3-type cytochrome oxidase maturation protein [Myxococcota bacterium]|jgi:cbb3-type cytochrome oxidase maturation protein